MSRKRWIKRALAGLLAIGVSGGCKQQIFMDPGDYKDALLSSLPHGIESRPNDTILPSIVDRVGPGPGSVFNTKLQPRLITLQECVAIALEQGNTGAQSSTNFGFKNELNAQFNGRGVGGSDAVRVFAIDPAIASAELERSLSKFDARWITSMSWQKVDQPTAAQFLSFQNSRDAGNFNTTLAKPLPTGGVAGITFSTDYSKFDTQAAQGSGFVNPNYTPRLQFTVEQPLLRLFGVEVNQLTPNHPGSQLLNLQPSGGAGTEGILVSRIRLDQQKTDFETKMNYLLLNVEAAYWNLFAAYYNLYAQEEGLRQAFEGYRFVQVRVITGTDPQQNQYQGKAQFYRFQGQVIEARGQVLAAERNLRGILNLRSDDGTRLVPIDKPNEAGYIPDFYEAANEALANRPELLLLRQELKVQQLNLLLQKNLRQPDLRSFMQYDIAGLGTRLDGREFANTAGTIPGNAFASFGNNNFNSWTIGFRLDMPIGFRDANAAVREAQLNLAKSYYQLRDGEMKALEGLVGAWRQVIQTHATIGPKRAERESLQTYLGLTKELIDLGRWSANDYQNFLTVQQQLAVAMAVEFRAIADYNTALAAFEFSKGTVQQYNNVTIGEGPLPPWVSKKAADHIRERTQAALKLRERDVAPPPGGPGAIGGTPVGPPTGSGLVDSLPPFAENRPPLPNALPDPRKVNPKAPDPKVIPPAKNDGTSFRIPAVTPGTLPQQPIPGLPASNAAGVPAPGDYFRSSGKATLPSIGEESATSPRPRADVPPAPLPRFPAESGLDPIPVAPAITPIPVPPLDGFGPAGSVPRSGTPERR